MFNYNREGFIHSHERVVKHFEANQRQVPHHLRKTFLGDELAWLAAKSLWPLVDASARAGGVAALHGRRYWRRSSSRALGLLFNGFAQLREFLPSRPSMA